MGLYDDVAGVLDHAGGSTDEAAGRFIDQSNQVANSDYNNVQRLNAYLRLGTRHTAGEGTEEFVWNTPGDGVFAGNTDDTDVAGGGLTGDGSITDIAVDSAGESDDEKRAEGAKRKAIIYAVGAAVALYLLAPVLGLAENLTE